MLTDEIADALARLDASFEALSEARQAMGNALDNALAEMTRRLVEFEQSLASPQHQEAGIPHWHESPLDR